MFYYTESSVTTSTRGRKMCRFFPHEFSVLRLHRTVGNYIFTRYVDIFYMSSLMFDFTEPSITTSSHGNKVYRYLLHEFDFTEPSITTSTREKDV